MGKTVEKLRRKAIGPVKWQPVAEIKKYRSTIGLCRSAFFVLGRI